ncbi:MAG: GNAT family N-acetyltransferase [Armatimonadota bacterium]|nr:MAG: GNAT family N-acetyltransferase [Armatimonadota bacterium]
MEILQFEPEMAAGVARCYSDLVAGVPHCAPVSAEAFAALEPLAGPRAHSDEMLVARGANSEVAGFVHLAVAAPPTEDGHPKDEPGLIRFLSYRPGQRAVGQALLDAAESWVRERERPSILAWCNDYMYPFYHLPFAHLSERISHVHALFGLREYTVHWSELLFEWRDFTPPAAVRPDLDFELRIEPLENITIGHKVMATGLAVRALRGTQEVGVCGMARAGEDFPRTNASDWCFCYELHVEESLRGHGLGKFLLATGLGEMKSLGCPHAAISTDWDNYRAALFYANVGYRLIDRTFSFRKEMSGGGGAAQD